MSTAEAAILFELQLVRGRALVFGRGVVPALALPASQSDDLSHVSPLFPGFPGIREPPAAGKGGLFSGRDAVYSRMSAMTPAPTVRPPSRIANRSSFSIAIGVIKVPVIDTLSPGITISTPSGNVTTPVTSVVLK